MGFTNVHFKSISNFLFYKCCGCAFLHVLFVNSGMVFLFFVYSAEMDENISCDIYVRSRSSFAQLYSERCTYISLSSSKRRHAYVHIIKYSFIVHLFVVIGVFRRYSHACTHRSCTHAPNVAVYNDELRIATPNLLPSIIVGFWNRIHTICN